MQVVTYMAYTQSAYPAEQHPTYRTEQREERPTLRSPFIEDGHTAGLGVLVALSLKRSWPPPPGTSTQATSLCSFARQQHPPVDCLTLFYLTYPFGDGVRHGAFRPRLQSVLCNPFVPWSISTDGAPLVGVSPCIFLLLYFYV